MALLRRFLIALLVVPLAGLALGIVTNLLSDAVAGPVKEFLGPQTIAILLFTAIVLAILIAAVPHLDTNKSSASVRVELPATVEALDADATAELRLTYLRTLERRIRHEFNDARLELDEQLDLLGQVTSEVPEAAFGAASQAISKTAANAKPAPIRDILPRYQRLMLHGGAGTGKTTTLQTLALRLIAEAIDDPSRPIPCFIRLRSFVNPEQGIKDFVISQTASLMGRDDPFVRHLGSYLAQGRCVLLLDGLNELPREAAVARGALDHRLTSLDEFVRATTTRAILTARELEAGQLLEWTQVKLLPLEEEAIIAHARRVVSEPDRIESFLKGLEPTMKELIRVPFFLAALLYLFRGNQASHITTLTRGQLLDYFITSRICAVERAAWETHYAALARLGARACEQASPDTPFTESRATEWLRAVGPPAATKIISTGERAGLLTRDTATKGRALVFTHPLYRHALAAHYLADQLAHRKTVATQRFVVGLARSWFGSFVGRGTTTQAVLAGDWVGVIRLTSEMVYSADVFVASLSEFLLTSSHWRLSWKLKTMYEPNFTGILAAHALAVIGTPQALDRLVQVIMSRGDMYARLYATMALMVAESADRIPRLQLLLDCPDPTVRYHVIGSLGKALPHEIARAALHSALRDADDHVRFRAAETLALQGDPAGIAVLRACQEQYHADTESNANIGSSIDQLPEGARASLLLLRLRDPQAAASVRSSFQEPDPRLVIMGAWAFYNYYFLQKTEYQDFNPPIKEQVTEFFYLLRLDGEGIAPELRPILEKGAPKPPRPAHLPWSQRAKLRLARLGDSILNPIAHRFAQWFAKRHGAQPYNISPHIDYQALANALRERITDPRDYVALPAIQVAGKALDKKSILPLAALLESTNDLVRQAAWWSLCQIGTEEAADEARQLMARIDKKMRTHRPR